MNTIQTYLAQAQALYRAQGYLPQADELRNLAVDLGMTHEESEEASAMAEEATASGRAALDEGRVFDGIDELVRAILLSPLGLEPHYLLADLYRHRWHADDKAEDRDMAIELAGRCLEIDKNYKPADELLEDVGVRAPLNIGRDSLSWKHALLIVVILVGVSGAMTTCVRYVLIGDPPAVEEDDGAKHLPATTTQED